MGFVNLGLVGALDDQFVDADVRQTARSPDDCVGHILGLQGTTPSQTFCAPRLP